MYTTEQKIDAMARMLLGDTEQERSDARQQLRTLLDEPAATQPDMEAVISDVLKQLGIPGNLYGSRYLPFAIEKAISEPAPGRTLTKPGGLYDVTAKAFNTTPSRVERAIRHSIEVAWGRGDLDVLQQYFGNSVSGEKGKPTNTEFIYTVANAIRLELKKNGGAHCA